jgi:transposase-like protein
LKGVQLVISDACRGLIGSLGEHFPEPRWQRCTVHYYRNVLSLVPRGKSRQVAAMLKAIYAAEHRTAALETAERVIAKLNDMKLAKASELIETGIKETLAYYSFPETHWRRIQTNNALERIMREIRRRTKVVGTSPDGESALMLCATRL